jgi:DNA repair protein RadB
LRTIADERKIGLVVLDSAAMLYRLEFAKGREGYDINREFGLQLSYLTEIARRKGIPVLITNQVYTDLDDGNTKMVGGDMLRYAAKCLIELQKLAGGNRVAVLRKHRSLPEEKSVAFRIVETGIEEVQLPMKKEVSPDDLFRSAYDDEKER